MDFAFSGFHGQVGTLYNAHLDLGAALCHALLGKFRDVLEGIEGIGQVSLQHDSGFQILELRLAHQALEQAQRQVEVVVFLHVHVDKDLWVAACGFLVERAQAVLQALHGTADVPVIQLRHHRGRLDGYVGHARVLDEIQRAARAGLCFLFTEHGLTQKVEIQLLAGSSGLFQGVIERIRFRVQHQVTNHLAHV